MYDLFEKHLRVACVPSRAPHLPNANFLTSLSSGSLEVLESLSSTAGE